MFCNNKIGEKVDTFNPIKHKYTEITDIEEGRMLSFGEVKTIRLRRSLRQALLLRKLFLFECQH